jgi:RNA polymerase sigma-70 factor (ECF subfamily)
MTPVDDPDRALIDEARRGEYDAFARLVERHERRIYSLAMSILRNRHDAEDTVQRAFLNAMENLDEFRGDAPFAAWINRIAANAALKLLRARRRFESGSHREEGDVAHPELIADWRYDPVEALEKEELRAALDEAIAALPESQRLAFLLRDVAGLSTDEAACELGIRPGNLKVRLLRARLTLREALTRRFGDPARRLPVPADHGEERSTPADALRKAFES